MNRAQKNEAKIKVPMKPKSKPPDPDPNAFPRQIEDQNRWVWDLY